MVGLYGQFIIGVLMQKPNDLKFTVEFFGEPSLSVSGLAYTTAELNTLDWSRVVSMYACRYDFPPIDTECEIKCKHGWEPCVIHSHNKLIVEIAGDLLIVDPEYARFRTRHPVFGVLKKFGVEVTDELSTALNDVLN